MPYLYESVDYTGGRDALEVWRECLVTMRTHAMNPELLELARDLAADIRRKDAGVSPPVLLARLAARLNALVVLHYEPPGPDVPMRADFLSTLVGLTAAELSNDR